MICLVYGESMILRARSESVHASTFEISVFSASFFVMREWLAYFKAHYQGRALPIHYKCGAPGREL